MEKVIICGKEVEIVKDKYATGSTKVPEGQFLDKEHEEAMKDMPRFEGTPNKKKLK